MSSTPPIPPPKSPAHPPATVEDVPEADTIPESSTTSVAELAAAEPSTDSQVSDNGNPFPPDTTGFNATSGGIVEERSSTAGSSSATSIEPTRVPLPPSDAPTPDAETEAAEDTELSPAIHERERFAYSSVGPFNSTTSAANAGPSSSSGTTSSALNQRSLADQAARGMPRLSGSRPAPVIESDNCRTCGKIFLPLFRKAHACGHCGYQYCENDCDQKAVLAKRGAGGGPLQSGGYELVEVCNNCFPMLQVTSGHPPYLRSLPLKRLQQYTKAYGLKTSGAIEKEDFVQTILKARTGPDGCLPPEAETYYRRRSVPKQGVLPKDTPSANGSARPGAAPSSSSSAPTNAAERVFSNAANSFQNVTNNVSNMFREATGQSTGSQQQQQQPQQQPRTTSNATPPSRPPQPGQYRPAPTNQPNAGQRFPPQYAQQQQQYRPAPSSSTPRPQASRPPQPSSSSRTTTPRPTPSKPTPRPPSPPVPTINSLVALPTSYISTLSIGTLKAILYENHVKVDFSQILEKGELARRVAELVREERKRLERQARAEEAEAAAEAAKANGHLVPPDATVVGGEGGDDVHSEGEGGRKSSDQPRAPAVPTGPQATPERDGLCVVCQDAEAQLAVVDCGHLAMCADCSKLVMATSRECPLCRTRIVTEQRLIRIFRT